MGDAAPAAMMRRTIVAAAAASVLGPEIRLPSVVFGAYCLAGKRWCG